jgi:hypothetical protein
MMELSVAQKTEIFERGFIKIPGVVPRIMVNEALKAMNHSLGNGIAREEILKIRSQSYCSEIQSTPVVSDLFNATPAFSFAESLLGKGKINPPGGAQIALRFPQYAKDARPKLAPHIDGTWSEHNGVPKGRILNFAMIACVLLSDVPEAYSGNFTVWPGTHRAFARHLQEHGPEILIDKGIPKIDMPEPHQVTGQAGDVVFAHYLLAHTAAPNLSPHVRYACFFRLQPNDRPKAPETGAERREAILDPWLEWPGLADITRQARAAEVAAQ